MYQYSLEDYYSDHKITFQKVATIRDSLGTGVMGHVAVEDKNRIYIANGGFSQKIQTIYVYDPKGDYIGDMGRRGSGPGEFNWLYQIAIQDGKLFAYDNTLRRINVFSLKSQSSIATIILNPQSWSDIPALKRSSPGEFYVGGHGKILLGFTDPLQPESSKKRYAKYYRTLGIQGLRSWLYVYHNKMRAVLITTLTTIGGLIPMIIFGQSEFWSQLATVTVWGLSTSTVLLLLMMGMWEKERLVADS